MNYRFHILFQVKRILQMKFWVKSMIIFICNLLLNFILKNAIKNLHKLDYKLKFSKKLINCQLVQLIDWAK